MLTTLTSTHSILVCRDNKDKDVPIGYCWWCSVTGIITVLPYRLFASFCGRATVLPRGCAVECDETPTLRRGGFS